MAKTYPVPSKADVDAVVAHVIEHVKVVQSENGRHYVTVQVDGKVPASFTTPSGISGRLNFAWFGLQDEKAIATQRQERRNADVANMSETEAQALMAQLQARLKAKK